MFEIGDLVIYGNEGVCRVEDIGRIDIPSLNPERDYYTLAPIYRSGKTYTPVDTTVFMRPVISYDEAQELIKQIPQIKPDVYEDVTSRELADKYKEFMQTKNCTDLIKLIKTVYAKRESIVDKKKKLGTVDEQYMQRAEDMLHGELAVVLDIPKDDIKEYLLNCVKELDDNEVKKQDSSYVNL